MIPSYTRSHKDALALHTMSLLHTVPGLSCLETNRCHRTVEEPTCSRFCVAEGPKAGSSEHSHTLHSLFPAAHDKFQKASCEGVVYRITPEEARWVRRQRRASCQHCSLGTVGCPNRMRVSGWECLQRGCVATCMVFQASHHKLHACTQSA